MTEYRNSVPERSPFQFYPNERLIAEDAGSPADIRLSDLDRLVLGAINRLVIVTSLLLHRYLISAGLENTTVEDIRTCLRRLTDNGYLNRLRFQTPTGQSNLRVYTLGELGRDVIHDSGRKALRSGYVDRMDSVHAKRQLAALQFVIGQGYVPAAAYTAFGRLVRAMDDPTGERLFRPQAIVTTQEKTVFVEAVRKSAGSVGELVRKLNRIQATLGSQRPLNLTGPENYEVVIVAQSYQHMRELMEELDNRLQRKFCFTLYFTSDQETFHQTGKLYTLPEKRSFGYKLPGKLAELFGL